MEQEKVILSKTQLQGNTQQNKEFEIVNLLRYFKEYSHLDVDLIKKISGAKRKTVKFRQQSLKSKRKFRLCEVKWNLEFSMSLIIFCIFTLVYSGTYFQGVNETETLPYGVLEQVALQRGNNNFATEIPENATSPRIVLKLVL